jgi:mono/diheme cytochrome c family protein
MRALTPFLAAVLWLAIAAATPAARNQASGVPPATAASDPQEVVTKYCATCHSRAAQAGGMRLDALDVHRFRAGDDTELGEKMVRRIRTGAMPPQGAPRPDAASLEAFVSWVEHELDSAERARPNPGRARLRRLNRAEYGNAVRDLLAVSIDPATLVPPDNAAFGFDNVADGVGLSTTLQERYLAAADRVSALAVGDPALEPEAQTYTVRQDVSQDQHIDGLPLGTLGGARISHTFPLDGEYELQVKLYRSNLGMMRGLQLAHPFEMAIDGRPVRTASVGGPADLDAAFDRPTEIGDAIDSRLSVRVPVSAGPRDVTLAFTEVAAALDTMRLQPFLKSAQDTLDWTGRPHVQSLTIKGPFGPTGAADTPSRRQIFICRPAQPSAETACASRIVSNLLRRAYRQEVDRADFGRAMRMFQAGRGEGSFETGVQRAIQFILASPKFIFRVEQTVPAAPGTLAALADSAFASQLSFFLWSSLPDDTLLAAAAAGTLREPRAVEAQVRRMLADRRSSALAENFAGQWLQLRNIGSVLPNSDLFPDFDDNLRQAMRRETELLFDSVVHEDRSVLDLLTADFTFVNERLARHYGVPGVYGSEFRRVAVRDEARRGLLGQAGILALTSHATRTSPVLRGKWVLENLLGTPPPPPPPNVPTLKEPDKGERPRSMRQQLAEHRANPTCASCHKVMDPIGFALENFDAVGAWRTTEGGQAIDVSGQLANGASVNGAVSLRQALLQRPDVFVGTMVEKLMVYALGRGLTAHDMPAVRQVVRDAAARDYKFSAVVLAVVRSVPFRDRIAPERAEDPRARQTASR